MSQRNLVILLMGVAVSYACYVRGEQNPYARHVASGLAAIEEGSLERVPNRELFEAAMQGMVDVLRRHGDEHSEFLPEEEADPLRMEIRQQFGGIGVRIRFLGKPPRPTIAAPPDPGTPADRANLRLNDQLFSIDGHETAKLSMSDVVRLMRGEPGSVVRLTIQHEHEDIPRTVEVVREIISIESILGDVRGAEGKWQFRLAAEPRIAHVRIAMFGDWTAEEFGRVLDDLTAEGTEAVVLDLRDNSGGALDTAVAVCDMLLPAERTIVETRGRGQTLRQKYVTTGAGRHLDLPLAVIVNQNSASAAEIVAACLQDHGRAVVVGERTYGKGTVQQLVPVGEKSLLKLTWASFWRPSGANIHRMAGAADDGKWGVVPNAGQERRLSPDEYSAYQKYRSARDVLVQAEAAAADPSDQPGTAAGFVDEQLRIAVETLQGALDSRAL